ncbi:MAG: DUF2920 family protein [Thermodesulfobacteriota bacterium]
MVTHSFHTIPGTPDFELGLARKSKIEYWLTLPDSEPPQGLVFYVHGFGGEMLQGYALKLRTFIAETYNLACVSVHPHLFYNRPAGKGENVFFEWPDVVYLNRKLQQHQCPQYCPQQMPCSLPGMLAPLKSLHDALAASPTDAREVLSAMIYPPHGELHTFGLLQAVDHLLVYYDLLNKIRFDPGKIIAVGSSHGGYIANLMAKLAPNTITAVFDNSAYPAPPNYYIAGRELNIYEHLYHISEHLSLGCMLKSGWTFNEKAANFYSPDRERIRSFLFADDIKEMARAGNCKTQFRFYHSKYDDLAPVGEKQKMIDLLLAHGFDLQYKLMDHENVDGTLVKNLRHGMDLSIKTMFKNFYPTIATRGGDTDIDMQSQITYSGFNLEYTFKFNKTTVIPLVR